MRAVLAQPAVRAAISAALTFAFIGIAPAEARNRAAPCDVVYDDRGRAFTPRGCVAGDRFYRAGPNRTVVVRGDVSRVGYRGANRARRGGRQLVFRDVIPARGRARIIVTEEIVYRRRGPRRVCTVTPVGVDADLIRYRRLERVAARSCSRRARIRIRA